MTDAPSPERRLRLDEVPPHIIQRWKRAEQSNRRRAREKGADSVPVNFVKIVIDYNARCCICFESIDIHLPGNDPRGLTLEHQVALGQGGHHVASNIGPAHYACNLSKNNEEDTPKAAKVKRVKTKFEEFFGRMADKHAEREPEDPRKKMGARPWPKGRKLQSRGFGR